MTNSPDQKIRQEYDCVINRIELTDCQNRTFDMKSQFVELMYSESIADVSPWGNIFMVDTVDFPTLLPMIGEETLGVSFTRQEVSSKENNFLGGQKPPIEFEMPIFRMYGKIQEGGSRKRQTYTLDYCTRLPFLNINAKVFATFKGMKYSDMVKKIYENHLKEEGKYYKPLIVEETEGSADYHINNVKPIAAIRRIASKSVSAEGNGTGYIFYEGRDAYYFVTLGKLVQKEPMAKLRCELKHVTKTSQDGRLGPKDKDMARSLYNIDNYTRNENFDVLGSATNGEAVSSLLSIDPITRRFYYNEFDLRKEDNKGQSHWGQRKRLGDKKPWRDTNKMFINPRSNLMLMVTDHEWRQDEYISNKSDEMPIHTPEEIILSKRSLGRQFDKHTISLTLSGDPTLEPGNVVEFAMPEILGTTKATQPEELDKWLQGKYLILAASHNIKGDEYHTHLTLVRDGFFTEIFHRDPVEYSQMKGV